jgi:hypothetical protein
MPQVGQCKIPADFFFAGMPYASSAASWRGFLTRTTKPVAHGSGNMRNRESWDN